MATQLDHSKQDVIDDNYIAEQEDNNKNNPHNHNAFDKPLHHIDLATARNIQCVAAANLELNNEYHQRALDQANKSFKYAWITACFAFLLFAVVVVFFMLNFTSLALIGTIGSAITAITSGTSFYLYRKTLSYYDDFHKCLARTELLLLGNSLCLQIHDKERQAVAYMELIKNVTELTVLISKENTKGNQQNRKDFANNSKTASKDAL